jgi:hypothetical protein
MGNGDLVCAGRRDCCLIQQRANSGLWSGSGPREGGRERGRNGDAPALAAAVAGKTKDLGSSGGS